MDIGIAIDTAGGDTRRVLVSGKLDTHTFGELDRQIAPLLEAAAIKTLVLDLDKLTYISSAGIRSVFKARKAMAARGGKLLVVHLQPQIRKVFDIVKAVPVGDVFASAGELDAYLDAMQRKVIEGDDDNS
jgi:anti-anti-sigma factor